MTMTRKDFRNIAYALNITNATPATIREVATACKLANPNFDRARFTTAATAEPEVIGWSCLGCGVTTPVTLVTDKHGLTECPECGYHAGTTN